MIKNRIKKLRKKFKKYNIDGYIVPKNDEFFSEYTKNNRLKFISNFTGSAGYSVILKNKNYLFVDGRYTIQAQVESSNNFNIVDYNKIINCSLFKNLQLGIDPRLFTNLQIKKFFLKNNKIKIINSNLIDELSKNKKTYSKPFFSICNKITGENYKNKINKIQKFILKNNSDYIFITAPENVAWTLNIRGHDNPNRPIPNCHLILDKQKNIYIIVERKKVKHLVKEKKINRNNIIDPTKFQSFIKSLKGKKIQIDEKTCSAYYENI